MSLPTRNHTERRPSPALAWLVGLGLVFSLLSGCGSDLPRMRGGERSPLESFVTSRVDSTGRDFPEVHLAVPYRALVFHRESDGFVSELEATVVAFRDGRRVGGGVARVAARVPDFPSTRARQKLSCVVPVAVRGVGPVDLAVTAKVIQTSRLWTKRLRFRPEAARALPLYFCDFGWDGIEGGPPEQSLGIARDSLRVRVRLCLRPKACEPPPGGLDLVAGIGGGERQPELVRRIPLTVSAAGSPGQEIRLAWAARDLPFGKLTLQIAMEGILADRTESLPFDPARSFVNLAVPCGDDRQWRVHLGWLDGIVASARRDRLVEFPPADRLTAWRALWRSVAEVAGVSPARAEAEHLLRIVEADEQFGVFGRGALSDRGRIFIRYGPPDRVESVGDDLSRESRWEVWYYFAAGRRFTFVDPHGLGDYHLQSSSSL